MLFLMFTNMLTYRYNPQNLLLPIIASILKDIRKDLLNILSHYFYWFISEEFFWYHIQLLRQEVQSICVKNLVRGNVNKSLIMFLGQRVLPHGYDLHIIMYYMLLSCVNGNIVDVLLTMPINCTLHYTWVIVLNCISFDNIFCEISVGWPVQKYIIGRPLELYTDLYMWHVRGYVMNLL